MKAMVLMGGGCTIRLMLCLMVMMLVCDKYDLLSWWINYGTQKPGQVSRINNSYQLQVTATGYSALDGRNPLQLRYLESKTPLPQTQPSTGAFRQISTDITRYPSVSYTQPFWPNHDSSPTAD